MSGRRGLQHRRAPARRRGRVPAAACLLLLAAASSAAGEPGSAGIAGIARLTGEGSVERPSRMSPVRAFLLSAAVPGLGQVMQGSRWGYAHMALDAASWTGWAWYRAQGSDGEDAYRRFADLHYRRGLYQDVVDEIYREYRDGECDPPGSGAFPCAELATYYNLDADTTTGHYYEDIGKLDKYIYGWEDWSDADGDGARDYDPVANGVDFGAWGGPETDPPAGFPGAASGLRGVYQDMRREANSNFDHAGKFSWLLVLNRLASGLHAAWMAHRVAGEAEGDTAGAGAEAAPGPERMPRMQLVVDRQAPGDGMRIALMRRFQ